MTNILLFVLSIRFVDIGLTFDDGPTNASYGLARMLADHKIVAMFFPTGTNLNYHPHFVSFARDLGHKFGNHTYDHLRLRVATENKVMASILLQHRLLGEARWFRYPDGEPDDRVFPLLHALGYLGIMKWDRHSMDLHGATYEQSARIAMKGGIILFHDCNASVAYRIHVLLKTIKEYKGNTVYRFVDPEELVSK